MMFMSCTLSTMDRSEMFGTELKGWKTYRSTVVVALVNGMRIMIQFQDVTSVLILF